MATPVSTPQPVPMTRPRTRKNTSPSLVANCGTSFHQIV